MAVKDRHGQESVTDHCDLNGPISQECLVRCSTLAFDFDEIQESEESVEDKWHSERHQGCGMRSVASM